MSENALPGSLAGTTAKVAHVLSLMDDFLLKKSKKERVRHVLQQAFGEDKITATDATAKTAFETRASRRRTVSSPETTGSSSSRTTSPTPRGS